MTDHEAIYELKKLAQSLQHEIRIAWTRSKPNQEADARRQKEAVEIAISKLETRPTRSFQATPIRSVEARRMIKRNQTR
jgi:hypothetical protein